MDDVKMVTVVQHQTKQYTENYSQKPCGVFGPKHLGVVKFYNQKLKGFIFCMNQLFCFLGDLVHLVSKS
jgi:hypothetical protein